MTTSVLKSYLPTLRTRGFSVCHTRLKLQKECKAPLWPFNFQQLYTQRLNYSSYLITSRAFSSASLRWNVTQWISIIHGSVTNCWCEIQPAKILFNCDTERWAVTEQAEVKESITTLFFTLSDGYKTRTTEFLKDLQGLSFKAGVG